MMSYVSSKRHRICIVLSWLDDLLEAYSIATSLCKVPLTYVHQDMAVSERIHAPRKVNPHGRPHTIVLLTSQG